MDSAETSVQAAERHLRQGEPLAAYNVAQEALERDPGHPRLRQLQALALARSGDVERANRVLAGLAQEGHDDSETLGMLARTHKDLASRAPDESTRASHLRAAFGLYDRAWRAARDAGDPGGAGYTGINAAAMAVLLGEVDRARAIAGEVRRAGPAAGDYWSEAIRGEAALILGENAAAREHYARATRLAGHRYGDLGTTRRQARLLEARLPAAGEPPSAALAIPPVVVFSGHMIDPPDPPVPRFPAGLEAAVRDSVRGRMAAIAPAAAYGSAACGADLICLEVARELGCETHIVLPFPAVAFRETSVDFSAADWGTRFDRALEAADSVTVASDHRAHGSAAAFEYANLILTGMARLRAQVLDTDLRGLAVLDAEGAAAPGGTRSIVALWEKAGIPVGIVGLNAKPRLAPASTGAAAAPPHGIRHEMRAMLFADVVGYSKLSEDQIPLYITQFLGAVAELTRTSAHRWEHVEVAGDGLYMVFADPVDAGRYALELSELANGTDWATRGLPAGFNLRIALHCGPVHCGRDPLTGGPIYTGPHTSRAARIEPITPPGQVYASSAFAAVAAAGGDRLALSYVGRMPLAKGYGALGLYHVRGAG